MKKFLPLFVASVFLLSLVAVGYSHLEDRANITQSRLMAAKDKLKTRISNSALLEGMEEHRLKVLEGIDPKFKSRLDNITKERLDKLTNLPPSIARKLAENADLDRRIDKWTVKNVSKDNIGSIFERRMIAAEALKTAENRLAQSRENFEKAKKNFKEKKDQFKKTGNLTDAKQYLSGVLDGLTQKINTIKEKVQGSNDLSAEKAKEVLAQLDSELSKLADWKARVENTTTAKDLKILVGEIKTGWMQLNHLLKFHGWRVALENFHGILIQAQQLDSRLNRWLTFADKNNITISDRDSRVADFSSKLTDSKKSYDAAVEDFKKLKDLVQNKTANTTDDTTQRNALVASIQSSMKDAKKSLKGARDVLVSVAKDLVKAMKDKVVTDSGKPVAVTEDSILNPSQVVDGVDTLEGQDTITVATEEAAEL